MRFTEESHHDPASPTGRSTKCGTGTWRPKRRPPIFAVSRSSRFYGRSPERLGPEDTRTYQLHLIDDQQLAPTSVASAVAALRFLYQVTLKRDWAVEALPLPKRGESLPVILSPEEVVRFLEGVASRSRRFSRRSRRSSSRSSVRNPSPRAPASRWAWAPRSGSPGTTARTREPGPPVFVRPVPGPPSAAGTPPHTVVSSSASRTLLLPNRIGVCPVEEVVRSARVGNLAVGEGGGSLDEGPQGRPVPDVAGRHLSQSGLHGSRERNDAQQAGRDQRLEVRGTVMLSVHL